MFMEGGHLVGTRNYFGCYEMGTLKEISKVSYYFVADCIKGGPQAIIKFLDIFVLNSARFEKHLPNNLS